jgi:hypothetical protein
MKGMFFVRLRWTRRTDGVDWLISKHFAVSSVSGSGESSCGMTATKAVPQVLVLSEMAPGRRQILGLHATRSSTRNSAQDRITCYG